MPVLRDFELINMEQLREMIELESFGCPAIKSVESSLNYCGIKVNGEPFLTRHEVENCMGREELRRLIKRKIEQIKEKASGQS